MRNLILGNKGMIGSYLEEYLLSIDEEVTGIDIKMGNVDNDLRYYSSYQEDLFEKADFVYFLAFDVGGSKYLSSSQNDHHFIYSNTQIMYNVFSLLEQYNKPFIFTSSQMSNMTESSYGILKLVGEKYTESLNGMIAKFWNVYGIQHGDPEKFYAVTDFIKNGLVGDIKLRTDGKEQRQFLHALDASRAMVAMSKHYEYGKKYDVTSFEWTSILDLANMIGKKLNRTVVPSNKKDSLQRASLEQPSSDILSIWTPEINLEDGINELIEEYRKEL